VKIVSFSGIDGAGKSTQIAAFESWLRSAGLKVRILTFWDNVVAFSRFRETVSTKAFGGDQGVGSPEKPLNRRDKNVKSWPVSALRFGLYCADAISLRRTIADLKNDPPDVVIFDRYLYDELANLPLQHSFVRAFVRMLLSSVPAPGPAYLIDADPDAARARKPEYPLEFLRENRETYLAVSRLTSAICVISPGTVEQMADKIRQAFLVRTPELNLQAAPAVDRGLRPCDPVEANFS